MTNRTWKSVYDIPFDTLFRGLPNGDLPWKRFTADVSILPGAAFVRSNDDLNVQFPSGFIEVPEGGDADAR